MNKAAASKREIEQSTMHSTHMKKVLIRELNKEMKS